MTAQNPIVLILGATSDIARPLARIYAGEGYDVVLAARATEPLGSDATDLHLRYGHHARVVGFDIRDTEHTLDFLEKVGPLPDTVICLVGLMTSQEEAQRDFLKARSMIETNYLGPAALLGEIAERMASRGSGTIIGVSSVAGDRGRASNYIYGSAKAGFTAFLSGLRNRLAKRNVTVITVVPGFIRTRMTEGLDLPARLTALPDEIARAIRRAHKKRTPIVYHRPIWRLIMLVIRSLPERIFMRTTI